MKGKEKEEAGKSSAMRKKRRWVNRLKERVEGRTLRGMEEDKRVKGKKKGRKRE